MLNAEAITDRCMHLGIPPASMESDDSIISSGKLLGAIHGHVEVEVHSP
jgi:hypothetical protein